MLPAGRVDSSSSSGNAHIRLGTYVMGAESAPGFGPRIDGTRMMMLHPSGRAYGRGLTLLLFLAPGASLAGVLAEDLAPERDQGKVATAILATLDRRHYTDVEVDDEFSESVLHRYLDTLDPSHFSLLASDVAEFERDHGAGLDDALHHGDLRPAFVIFNRFRERILGQMHYLEAALDGIDELSFDVPETLALDRSEAPWPASEAAARDLWRKRFKNDVLVQRLDGKSPEQIRTTLERRYRNQVRQVEQTESGDVFNIFMNVVTGSFDPHTNYFPPRDAANFDMQMSLSFQGIGAELTTDGEFAKVARLIPGGPAEKSGEVHPMDRIIAVGQQGEEMVDVVAWRLDEVVDLIRGPAGTRVRLALRAGDSVDGSRLVTLVREQVKLEEQAAKAEVIEVEREGRAWKVGVIELPTFYVDFDAARAGDPHYKSSARDVARLVREMRVADVDGIVMDLRGNGGGSLEEAQSLSALFLGPGPVVQIRDEAGRVQVLGSRERALYDGTLVVLVDRLSASASEIFAAAVQDRGRGLVVGSDTFGKGTVQTIRPLELGQLKLTQAKFYRISGGSTQERGVTPDIEFPSRFDPDEVGESALPAALPWDSIRAVDRSTPWFQRRLPELRSRHAERSAADLAFVDELEEIRVLDEMRHRSEVSLVEADRRRQVRQDQVRLLEIENDRRVARGLEPVDDLEELQADGAAPKVVDAFLREAAEVLVDLRHFDRVVAR